MCFYREDKLLAKRAFSKFLRAQPIANAQEARAEPTEAQTLEIQDPRQVKPEIHEEDHFTNSITSHQNHHSTEVSQEESEGSHGSPLTIMPHMTHMPHFPNPIMNDNISNMLLANYMPKRVHIAPTYAHGAPNYINMFRPVAPIAPIHNVKPAVPMLDSKLTQEIFKMIQINTGLVSQIQDFQQDVGVKLRKCVMDLKEVKAKLAAPESKPVVAEPFNSSKVARIEQAAQEAEHHNSNPTSSMLFNHLFGASKIYRYELVLTNQVPNLLIKDKNLVLKLELVDTLSRNVVQNTNKIHLQVQVQTWEIPSTNVTRNKNGNRALNGQTEAELKEGHASFERVQVSEVTSKFMHGYVAIVVVPSQPSNHGTYLPNDEEHENFVNYDDIKPLMIEKIVVKSKKKPYM